MDNNKKRKLMIMITAGIILILTGTSYALWQITLKQTTKNIITTGCFKVSIVDKDAITLNDTYPISDDEAKKLAPYEFTLTNNCKTIASYQINLEILENSTLENLNNLKFMLDNKTSFLTSKQKIEPTINTARESYKLKTGYLKEEESITYKLNLWLDEHTIFDESLMNKVINSKVTIISSFIKETSESFENASAYIASLISENELLVNDDTNDRNIRFIGQNPNNYVLFNDEKWRIIGVMNNIDNGTGKKESRLKLVRAESIGSYSWDTSTSDINSGNGVNEWSQAKIMKLLNPNYETEAIGGSLYWNKQVGNCYNDPTNATIECDFTTSGLTDEAKNMIEKATWYTGSNDGTTTTATNMTASKFYTAERSNNIGKICNSGSNCNDNIERTVKWDGYVGLIYPSDYAYATSGGPTSNRNICLEKNIYDWRGESDCYINNWLYNQTEGTWTMTPVAYASLGNRTFYIQTTGAINSYRTGLNSGIYPTVYLKADTLINTSSGNGTIDSPFIIKNNI